MSFALRVVILAAGQGKRMGASVPKPLVPIAGKPMVAHLLERIAEAELDMRPCVVVSPGGKGVFEETLGDKAEFAIQEEPKGTAHATAAALPFVCDASHVMVLYGDHPFLPTDVLRGLGELAQEHPEALVLLTAVVPHWEGEYAGFTKWGRILRNEAGQVIGSREYKDATEEERSITEVNPCMYVFPRVWLEETLPKISNQNASGEYYLTDAVALALQEGEEIVTKSVDALAVIGVNTPEEVAVAEKLQSRN